MRGRCPTPGKRAYSSKQEARRYSASPAGQLRPYRCECGAWHLSKLPAAPDHVKRRRPKRQAR